MKKQRGETEIAPEKEEETRLRLREKVSVRIKENIKRTV